MANRWNSTFKQKVNKGKKRVLRVVKVKTKVVPVTKLKKQIWALLREIAFKKYGIQCYTCGAKELLGSNRHLGHFVSSSVCSVELRYSLDNLRTQCYRCNIHLSGNWISFESHLKADGIDVEALKRRNEETKGLQYDRIWYTNKLTECTTLLAELK